MLLTSKLPSELSSLAAEPSGPTFTNTAAVRLAAGGEAVLLRTYPGSSVR
jgi:hypothetical protein